MKFRVQLVLRSSDGPFRNVGRQASEVIDNKYPDLDFMEMYPKPTPPAVQEEYDSLVKTFTAAMKNFVHVDGRVGEPYDCLCVEFDTESKTARLLPYEIKTTASGFRYAKFDD
mgnify:CR=1 FL=1